MTTTESANPSLRSFLRKRARDAVGEGRVSTPISLDPFRFLAHVQKHQRKGENDDEKHDNHGGRVADVVERERLQVQVEIDGLRRGARAALADDVDGVERLQRVDSS